ncbi:MAG: uroporphyrinogen decarboxylase family protein [Christensenella sp.]
MNGYERMLATLNKEKVDHTPSMEIMIDQTIINALTNTGDYMDLCDLLDLDAVITNTPSTLYRNEIIDAEKGIFKNEWGTVRLQGKEVVSAIVDEPIKKAEDVYSYLAPDPNDEYRFEYLRALLKRFKGKRLVGMHIHDSFNYPYYLMGMENLFVTMFENPDVVHKIVEISVEHNIALAKKAVSLGADYILLGDDYGGGNQLLVSPDMFREFFLPGFRKVVSAVKDMGVFCFKHCCGDINEILDDMVSTGIDVLHPLDPSANMDILAVKEKYKNLVVMGGINCYQPLCEFSEEEIAEETRMVIGTIGMDGRYIIASSNSVHSDAKPENYAMMQKVRRETPVIYK